jgi:UDP-N-acetylglucosamine 3-dehydrogenase
MSPMRFGVVGCGAISTLYQLPALGRTRDATLVATVDVDAAHAAAVAHRFGASESFTDHHDLVGRVDAALIATPNTTHADIACDLLAQGVHVLCEKPMATSRADVDRMLAAAERSGARLMAAHCLRFSPNLERLHDLVAAGVFGDRLTLSASIGAPYDAGPQRTDFRRTRGLSGGGVLMDVGIHVIDMAVWMVGEAPADVAYDASAVVGWEVESDAEVALRFPSGSTGRFSASFTRVMDPTYTVRGERGWARASLYHPSQLTLFSDRVRLCRLAGVQDLVLADTDMYDRQLAHFVEAVRNAAPFRVRPEEVRATIDVVERCYDMAEAS